MDTLKGKSFLSMANLTEEELRAILQIAEVMKKERFTHYYRDILSGISVAILFQKPSLRTLDSFQTGILELGGMPIVLPADSVQMEARESITDVARTIACYNQMIVARVFEQEILEKLMKHSKIPVINAFSDLEHPCQAVGDFLTILEKFYSFSDLHLVFMGDGNNVCHSLMLGAALLGMKMTVCCPREYQPKNDIIDKSVDMGLDLSIAHNPSKITDAHIVYTDVWASMGRKQEAEAREKVFKPYQVNSELLSRQNLDVIFMHCLPAERGREVTNEVIEGPQSVVFQQAENRLHAQKALLALIKNPEAVAHLLK